MDNVVYRNGEEVGYIGHFTGAYVCYTCGVLCDCEGEE